MMMPLPNPVSMSVRPRQRVLRRHRLHRNVQSRIVRKDRTAESRRGRHQMMKAVLAVADDVGGVHRVAVKAVSTTALGTTIIMVADRTASVVAVDAEVEVVVIPAIVVTTDRETIAIEFAPLLRVLKLSKARSTEFLRCIPRGTDSLGMQKKDTLPRNPTRSFQVRSLKNIVCVKE
jgi:hypothetical protein